MGEPGVGKSRLLDELKDSLQEDSYDITASEFDSQKVPHNRSYYIIDALDEVENYQFFHKLQEINNLRIRNPKAKIIFSCRTHYVASYANQFSSLSDLTYIKIVGVSREDVESVITSCSEETKENIKRSVKLSHLLTIPRYLVFLLKNERENGGCKSIGELFEYIITESIRKAIENKEDMTLNKNVCILIKRSLEKVALIMEISGRDTISKDELYSILDGLKGNMAQMMLANFDLLFFQSRIMKETNEKLQFENTELQEYLAAQELYRQTNIESFLYDVAVNKDFKHLSDNWYDVIPHLSYTSEGGRILLSILKLIIGYEAYLENATFESLLRYVDPTLLNQQDKEDLFSLLLEHYLKVPSFIHWHSNVYNLLKHCYTPNCFKKLLRSYKSFTYIQLQNIQTVLEAITEERELNTQVLELWNKAAKYFMGKDKDEFKIIALALYGSVKDHNSLISLSKKYNEFSRPVKEKYCDVTSQESLYNKSILNCWIESCFLGNPHAIQAVAHIDNTDAMFYAYNEIITHNKIDTFFNPKGSLSVLFE